VSCVKAVPLCTASAIAIISLAFPWRGTSYPFFSPHIRSLIKNVVPPIALPRKYDLVNGNQMNFGQFSDSMYECTFLHSNIQAVCLWFSSASIKELKKMLYPQVKDDLDNHNFVDETGIGIQNCVGKNNWCSPKDEEGAAVVHHLRIEAALCNASPMCTISQNQKNQKLGLQSNIDHLIQTLKAIT
jgi:hypothetical protein